jgi:hypothetical protein
MRLIVFLPAIGGDGYSTPSKISARMLDEQPISEACYLMQRCEVSLAPNEPSERPRSALRDSTKEPEQRPHSALRGLLDAVPDQPKPTAHQSALSGILGVQK